MGYLLYGANGSGSSIVEAVLAEIGADYQVSAVDAKHGAQREAAYASVNPHRKLPTLITPAGETLTESAAIVLTLDERHPEAGLLPSASSPPRAQALRWLMFAATGLYPIMEIMDHPERFSPGDGDGDGMGTKHAVRELAFELWRERWRSVEHAIGDGPFFLGASMCLTDIYLAVLSRWDLPEPWRSANLPKVQRLAIAVSQRPRLREVWPRHFPKG